VLTNIGYLSGYCEAVRNPAGVSFSMSSMTVGSTAKRPNKFFRGARTRSATHEDFTNSDRAQIVRLETLKATLRHFELKRRIENPLKRLLKIAPP
jgi:hypothetical protein